MISRSALVHELSFNITPVYFKLSTAIPFFHISVLTTSLPRLVAILLLLRFYSATQAFIVYVATMLHKAIICYANYHVVVHNAALLNAQIIICRTCGHVVVHSGGCLESTSTWAFQWLSYTMLASQVTRQCVLLFKQLTAVRTHKHVLSNLKHRSFFIIFPSQT